MEQVLGRWHEKRQNTWIRGRFGEMPKNKKINSEVYKTRYIVYRSYIDRIQNEVHRIYRVKKAII